LLDDGLAPCIYVLPGKGLVAQLKHAVYDCDVGATSVAAAESRRQVPRETSSPAAVDHLGRRADRLLPQGDLSTRSQAALQRQQVPVYERQTPPRRQNWTHDDAGPDIVL